MDSKTNVPISGLTTFQNGGDVRVVRLIKTLKALAILVQSKEPYFLLGKGSNTVINPNTSVAQFVQLTPDLTPIRIENDHLICGAGISVQRCLQILVTQGLGGLEFSAGVPATIGGMTVMNFGCWGKSLSDWIVAVRVMKEDGHCHWIPVSDCGYSYRSSLFQSKKWVVIEVRFQLMKQDPAQTKSLIQANIQKRVASQPLRGKTFGSVFKNPAGTTAGKLLEESGFRGFTAGSIRMSDQHANFMENLQGASFNDVVDLIEQMRAKVAQDHGVQLDCEVQLVR